MRSARVIDAANVLRDLSGGSLDSAPTICRVAFRQPDGRIGKRDFATHWIHRYPAKMFHRIPRIILQAVAGSRPMNVLDPFCGSGTVLLESILSGHDAIGIDVNPMAQLISRVKTTPIEPAHLSRHLRYIKDRALRITEGQDRDEVLDFWFKPDVRYTLHALLRSINSIDHVPCREFFTVCLSACVRPCSWADPTISPPVKLCRTRARVAGDRYRKHYKRANSLTVAHVLQEFDRTSTENLRRMSQLFGSAPLATARIIDGNCEASSTGLLGESVDLVLTSPPYCGAQKYVRSLRLEMLMLGMSRQVIAEADRRTLGTERVSSTSTAQWTDFRSATVTQLIRRINARNQVRAFMLAEYISYLDQFAKELRRVLKHDGDAFVTFGTDHIAGFKVDSAAIFADLAASHSLQHVATLIDHIPSRGMITIRHSTAGTISDERVVWLRRG